MPWVLLDIVIAVVAVLVLAATGLVGYRHVRGLMRTVGGASERVGDAMASIEAAQASDRTSTT